jgi:ATP-dependent HslUV protease subunit HslV
MSPWGARPHATTILGVKRGGTVAMAGDGQVTLGDVVLKHGARKIRLMDDGRIVAGFAGAVADALTLFGKFESQLKASDGNVRRASVELAKEWRTDRYLRRLEAQLLVADAESILVISGEGDVIEPDDGIVAIGSGAPYATAAAKALMQHSKLDAVELVKAAMEITADICIFTNHHFTVESVSEPVTEDAVADETATTGETEPEPEPEKPKSRSRKKGAEG